MGGAGTRHRHLRGYGISPGRPPRRVYLIYAVRHGHRVIYQAIHAQMITRRAGPGTGCRGQMHV
jgi:hypothetical protein